LENVLEHPRILLPLDGSPAFSFAPGAFVFSASPLAFSFNVGPRTLLLNAHLLCLRPCGLRCR
jgi:hypothetical protein